MPNGWTLGAVTIGRGNFGAVEVDQADVAISRGAGVPRFIFSALFGYDYLVCVNSSCS